MKQEPTNMHHVTLHKPKKPWYKRFWVWFGIVVVLLVIGAASSPKDVPKKVDSSTPTTVSTNTEQKQQEVQTVFKVGDLIAFDEKKVSVTAVQHDWKSSNQFDTPDKGNEFVKVQVSIQNDSADDISYNTYDWSIQDSKGVIKDIASETYSADDRLSSEHLAAGGKVSGALIFEVPKGDSGLTLRYIPMAIKAATN